MSVTEQNIENNVEHLIILNRRVRVAIISSDEQFSHFYSIFKKAKIVGFDVEWRSTYRNLKIANLNERGKVSLVQIATNSVILLIQMMKLKNFKYFSRFLSDEAVFKVGVGIKYDAQLMLQDYNLLCNSLIDLNHFYGTKKNRISLSKLTKKVLNVNLQKKKEITLSDWQAENLSKEQIRYAAADALAAKLIFDQFRLESDSIPFRNISSNITKDNALKVKSKRNILTAHLVKRKREVSNSNAKSFLYDNCKLLAPDGEVISIIPLKKMKWYLNKDLAEAVGLKKIKLKFEPSHRTNVEQNFYLAEKKNICVSCGGSYNLTKFYIVPYEFRKHFPFQYRVRTSHDVILLCLTCRDRICPIYRFHHKNFVAQTFKEENISLTEAEYNKHQYVEDVLLKRIQKLIRPLIKFNDRIPDSRKAELTDKYKNTIKGTKYDSSDTNIDSLKAILERQSKHKNDNFVSSDALVVKILLDFRLSFGEDKCLNRKSVKGIVLCDCKLCRQNNTKALDLCHLSMQRFVRFWRTLFMKTLEPNFMPTGWSIFHKIQDYNDPAS